MAKRIDYTKMRLGSVARRWEYKKADGTTGIGQTKIAKCPKCGRKGEKIIHKSKAGIETSHEYHHGGNVNGFCGFEMLCIDDHCSILTPEGERMNAERKAAKAKESVT